jgi:hypothetical protein
MKAIEIFDPDKPEGKSGFRVQDHVADAVITLLMAGFTDGSKQE